MLSYGEQRGGGGDLSTELGMTRKDPLCEDLEVGMSGREPASAKALRQEQHWGDTGRKVAGRCMNGGRGRSCD